MTELETSVPRYCTCSDPDYCLRGAAPEFREAAIAYRRERGAPLPRSEKTVSDEVAALVEEPAMTPMTCVFLIGVLAGMVLSIVVGLLIEVACLVAA